MSKIFHMYRFKIAILLLLFNSLPLFAMEKTKMKDIIFSIDEPERYIIEKVVSKLKANNLNVRFSEKGEQFPLDATIIQTYLGYSRDNALNPKAALNLFLGDPASLKSIRYQMKPKNPVYCEADREPKTRKLSLVDSDACFKELQEKITELQSKIITAPSTEKEIKTEKKTIVLQVSAEDVQKAQDLKKELATNGVQVQIAIRGESLPQNSIPIPLALGLK